MKYKLIPRRVSRRGKSFASYEPARKFNFKKFVKFIHPKPWTNVLLGDYIIHLLNNNPELAFKLNLIASDTEHTNFFIDLLALTDLDVFSFLSLIELFIQRFQVIDKYFYCE